MLTAAIKRWIGLVQRHPLVTIFLLLLISAGALSYSGAHLSLDTSTSDLFSRSLAWRKDEARLDHAFPQLNNTIVIAIDGATPALANEAAQKLANALSTDHKHFTYVYAGRNTPFLRRNGLLFLSTAKIRALTRHLTKAQPVLAQLVQEPDLPGLLSVMGRVMTHADTDKYSYAAQTTLAPFFNQMGTVFSAAAKGKQRYLSWQSLFALDGQSAQNKPEVVLVKPRLNYRDTLPAQAALSALHRTVIRLGLTPNHGVNVHLTGSVVFQHHDLRELMRDLPLFGGLTVLLVTALLLMAMRDWRMLVGTVVTLVFGLLLTTGFAAVAFGRLNLLSIAFVMLYWGMGVDYAIHFCLAYRGARLRGLSHALALDQSVQETGIPLVGSALTTAAAFYVFVLTRFTALSELGLIAGTGMIVSLFMTFTALPAFLTLLPPNVRPVAHRGGSLFTGRWRNVNLRHRKTILYSALVIAIGAAFLVPRLHFQVNPIKLRDPHTDAVKTFNHLVKSNPRSAFSASVLAPNARSAQEAKAKLAKLKLVSSVVDLGSWIPADQDAKLSTLDLWRVLVGPLAPKGWKLQQSTNAERLKAIENFRKTLRTFSSHANGKLAVSSKALLGQIDDFSSRITNRPEHLGLVATGLLAGLPNTLRSLDESLRPERITRTNLPEKLRHRWVSPDGLYRIAVYPQNNLMNDQALVRFVHAVTRVAPHATGTPVIMVHAAQLVSHAFLEALAYTLLITIAIVWFTFRNIKDTIYTLIPLVFGGLLTCATMVLLGRTFNFANVVALPLLFGAGVDYSIHIVSHARRHRREEPSLSSVATRAVVFSALTTLASFGNLAFTGHGGPASMGFILALGLVYILISDLILLPALLGKAAHPDRKALP